MLNALNMTKKITLIFATFLLVSRLFSQCAGGVQFPAGTFTPTTTFTAATNVSYAGEYVIWNVFKGSTYTWSTCSAVGGNALYDSELTLLDGSGTTVLDHSDDYCDDDAQITWTATYT
jgi:hypothetical protein